jgi:hypothetical protein
MYSKNMKMISAPGTLVEVFSLLTSLSMNILMIIVMVQSLMMIKDALIAKPIDAFIDRIYLNTPLE